MSSALRRGAAIAGAGGGRPNATTQEPARARSSNEADHLEYMASREAQAVPDAKRFEALRWQLEGVTAELDEARYELSELVAALAASAARVRLVIQDNVIQQEAEEVHAAAEEAHQQQQQRQQPAAGVHAEAEEAHRQQQHRRNQH